MSEKQPSAKALRVMQNDCRDCIGMDMACLSCRFGALQLDAFAADAVAKMLDRLTDNDVMTAAAISIGACPSPGARSHAHNALTAAREKLR